MLIFITHTKYRIYINCFIRLSDLEHFHIHYCVIKLQNKTRQTHNQPFKDKRLYTYFYFRFIVNQLLTKNNLNLFVSKLNAYCILICSNKWYERFLIHGRLYFELSYGTMQLTLDCPFWYFLSARSELIYNLLPEAQPIKRVKKVAKMISFRTVTVYSKTWSSQCKLNAQTERVQVKENQVSFFPRHDKQLVYSKFRSAH